MKITFGDDATEALSSMLSEWIGWNIRIGDQDFKLLDVGHDFLPGGVLGIMVQPYIDEEHLYTKCFPVEVTDELDIHVY